MRTFPAATVPASPAEVAVAAGSLLDQYVKLAEGYFIPILLIALLVAGAMVLKKLWPTLTQVVAIGNALGALPATMTKIDNHDELLTRTSTTLTTMSEDMTTMKADLASAKEDIAVTKAEVLPNHGGSFRDQHSREMRQVRSQLMTLNKRVKNVEGRATHE